MPVLDNGTQVGPFEILDVIKRGGMAQVYHARHRSTQTEFALKVNLTDTRAAQQNSNSLRQEVDLLTSLNYPGIVRPQLIHLEGAREPAYMARASQIDGQPWYYAMEYLRGGSLEKHIKDIGALPFNLSALLMWRVAATLEYLHSRKVAHLDIKPDNIVLRYPLRKHERIEPVLIDFGVAARITHQNASGGTLITMSPEYIRKLRGELDPQIPIDLEKVDIYALGVVTYRLWTGKYPFDDITNRGLTSAILNRTIPNPTRLNPNLPKQADDLMKAWLSKNPADRPNLTEIQKQLQYFTAGMKRLEEDLAPPQSNKPKFWIFGGK